MDGLFCILLASRSQSIFKHSFVYFEVGHNFGIPVAPDSVLYGTACQLEVSRFEGSQFSPPVFNDSRANQEEEGEDLQVSRWPRRMYLTIPI
jgi:hypothetical protein